MNRHTHVVAIKGGIAGCSTSFHLTQEGRSDVAMGGPVPARAADLNDPKTERIHA